LTSLSPRSLSLSPPALSLSIFQRKKMTIALTVVVADLVVACCWDRVLRHRHRRSGRGSDARRRDRRGHQLRGHLVAGGVLGVLGHRGLEVPVIRETEREREMAWFFFEIVVREGRGGREEELLWGGEQREEEKHKNSKGKKKAVLPERERKPDGVEPEELHPPDHVDKVRDDRVGHVAP
jgi:hypothetical protein